MDLETEAFRQLLADDANAGNAQKRRLICLVLDEKYLLGPFERTAINIYAFPSSQDERLQTLKRAIGVQ